MRFVCSLLLLAGLCALVGVPGGTVRAEESGDLTPEALAAVKQLYPNAEIVDVGQERERGVLFYEVTLRDGEARLEIEVTPDGTVGEIETVLALADVPLAVRDGISSVTTGASIAEVERHEIHGVPRGDGFEAVDPPMVAYEVEYRVDGRSIEVVVGEDGRPLAMQHPDGDDDSSGDDSSDSSDGDSSGEHSSDDSDSDSSGDESSD